MNPISHFRRFAGVLASALLAFAATAPAALARSFPPRLPGWDKHRPLPSVLVPLVALATALYAAGPTVASVAGAPTGLAHASKAAEHVSVRQLAPVLPVAASHPAVAADGNPANPNCNSGAVSTFSGGTGAFYSNSFDSDYVSAPFTGAADVPNANFTNVFLYPNSGTMTWDQYVNTLPAGEAGPTQQQIDAMTTALVCSSYFDALTQYNINPPAYSGDETTIPACVTAALHDAMSTGNVISYATMRTFAACEQSGNGDSSTQVNIFVAPGISASTYGQDGTDMCSAGHNGYHGWGLGVPNFTVLPTDPSCNPTPGSLMQAESHEMVELLSDPGGFGWLHTGDFFNFDQKLDEGELADICSSVGEFPTPASNPGEIPFPDVKVPGQGTLSGLMVSPYWSDQDDACVPTSIMNDILVPLAGSPSIRFTGSTHNLVAPIVQHNPPAGILDSLELDVVTGNDDLRSSSSANVIVTVNLGGGTILKMQQNDINEGAGWGNNSLHEVQLQFPPGIPVSDVTQITLNTQFGGGIAGDNWDVAGLEVQADVTPNTGSCGVVPLPLVNDIGTTKLSDGHKGLFRFTGGHTEEFPVSLAPVPAADKNLLVTGLYLTVGTSGDNLNGGNSPNDNANAIMSVTGSPPVKFANINSDAEWPNNSVSPQITLLNLNALPPGTTAGHLKVFDIETDLPGGLFGDNWDMSSVLLTATLGCKSTSTVKTVTQTLVTDKGTATLGDGSKGLCRLTGSVHDCTVTVPAAAGLSPSDVVDSMQMTIVTGDDDLRGGGFPEDNADVCIVGSGGSGDPCGGKQFLNVNESDHWPNGFSSTFPLIPGGSMTLADVGEIDVSTMFGGGSGGDNWDIASISLSATVTVPGPGPAMPAGEQAGPGNRAAAPAASAVTAARPAAPLTVATPGLVPRAPGGDPSPWTVVPSANATTADNVLNGTSCFSPVNCFAVGYSIGSGGVPQALIEQWNGTSWVTVTTPSTGQQYSELNSVSCSNKATCVAVGFDGSGSPEGTAGLTQALIETWNASSWSVQVSADPPGAVASMLNSVSCTPTYCDAVGYQAADGGDAQTLVENFAVGRGWTIQPSPSLPSGDSEFNGVSCVSSTYCVAVGQNDGTGTAQTLSETWQGAGWAVQTTPDVGGGGNVFYGMGDNVLYSVSCYAYASCIAVGADISNSRQPQPLIESTQSQFGKPAPWTIAPSANPGGGGAVLDGVSCLTGPRCVAVGFSYSGSQDETLNENNDGGSWVLTPVPDPASGPAGTNYLIGDWCVTPVLCYAVGDSGPGTNVNRTMAMQLVATAPNEPTSVTAKAGDEQATVSFAVPSDNGSYPVTSYRVLATDATNASNGGQVVTGTASPVVVPGLTNGDSYTFTVTAINSIGTGPASAPSSAVVPHIPLTVTAAAPNKLRQGAKAVPIVITGNGFAAGDAAKASGTGVSFTSLVVVNATTIKALATVTAAAAKGTRTITVSGPFGPATCANCLTVDAAPTVASASPPTVAAGAAGKVTVKGTGYQSGATVTFSGGGLTASVLSVTPTTITVSVTVPSGAPVGHHALQVSNPDHGTIVCALCFSVIAAPKLISMSPAHAATGSTTTVTLFGSGFAAGAVVTGPTGVTFSDVKVVGSTEITATMTISTTAPTGSGLPIVVRNTAAAGYGQAAAKLLAIS